MRSLNLSKSLHIKDVNEEELHAVLLSFFGNATYPTSRIQRLTKRYAEGSLELRYTGKGAIHSAITDMDPAEIQKLSDHIAQHLIENQVARVGQTVCFSDEGIKGAFRYDDLFQILPAGTEYPDVLSVIADHPFILQFRFIAGPDPIVNDLRRKPIIKEYICHLNAVCRSGLQTAPTFTDFCWCIDTQTRPMTTRWMQRGYSVSSVLTQDLNEYSPIGRLPAIPMIAAPEYYKHGFRRSTDDFALPDNIHGLIGKIRSLTPDRRKRFDLACTWLSMSRDISKTSSSAEYISRIAPVEALLQKKAETCSSCGQPKYSIAKTLKDFLKRYVPGIEEQPHALNQIYRVRSDLAHGLELLLTDLGQFGSPSPGSASEMMLQYNAAQIAGSAVLNWLQEQGRDQNK